MLSKFFQLKAQFYTLNFIVFHFDSNINKSRPSLANYLLFFFLKSKKMPYLHCVVKFKSWKLGCASPWFKNAIPPLRKCVSLQPKRKVHCGSCASLPKLKKMKLPILRCNFYWLKRSLRLSLLVSNLGEFPTREKFYHFKERITGM